MPPINATVYSTHVDPDTITIPMSEPGAVVIQWRAASGQPDFKITGLDPNVFSPAESPNFKSNFSTTTANRDGKSYDYNVVIQQGGFDPKIMNGA